MNIPFLCIFLAFILNYLSKFPVGYAMAKSTGGYDNRHPRDQQAQLTGFGKRALGAHLNGFETFPAFAVSVILATLAHADEYKLTLFCIGFIISRVIYILLYLMNKPTLRSMVWMIGIALITANFALAIF